MAWVAVGVGVGGAVLGGINGARKEAQQQRFNQAQAEITRYSPWTHMTGSITAPTSDPFGGALQGGVQGLALGQGINKAMGPAPVPGVADSLSLQGSPQSAPSFGPSYLGGQQQAAQLGQLGNNSAFTGMDNQNMFASNSPSPYSLFPRR